MARPSKEGIDYFPHDCDASRDEKIESLCAIYGHHVAYSIVFRLYERIYRGGGKLIVSEAETMQILARNVAEMDVCTFKKFLESCFKLDVLDITFFKNGGILTSKGIIKRMEPIMSKRIKMKEIYEKSQKKEGVSTPISEVETLQKPDKVKDSRVEKRIGYLASEEIDKKINERLGSIATKDLIKAVLIEIPEEMRWKVDNFLKKRYPEGGNGYQKAMEELRDVEK